MQFWSAVALLICAGLFAQPHAALLKSQTAGFLSAEGPPEQQIAKAEKAYAASKAAFGEEDALTKGAAAKLEGMKAQQSEEKKEDKNEVKVEKKENKNEAKIEKKEEEKKAKAAANAAIQSKIEKKEEKKKAKAAADAAIQSLLNFALGNKADGRRRPIESFNKNPFKSDAFKHVLKNAVAEMDIVDAARVKAAVAKASADFDKAKAASEEAAAEKAADKKAKKAHDEALDKMSETNGAPSQGFNEYSGKTTNVEHDDGVTMTSDWGKEWPRSHESELAAQKRICRSSPSKWCKDRGYA